MNKLLTWLKGVGWIAAIGTALAAAIFGWQAAKAANKTKRAEQLESTAVNLMNSKVSSEINRGKQMHEKAGKEKDKAEAAKKAMTEKLEQLGAENETIDDIAHRFNSERVRLKSSAANS